MVEIKATEQYFPVVLFIKLYKIVPTLGLWRKSQNATTVQMKATEQYFPVVFWGGSRVKRKGFGQFTAEGGNIYFF